MKVSRRRFLKGAAAVGGVGVVGGAAGGLVLLGKDHPEVAASLGVDRVVRTTCSPNCTGSCEGWPQSLMPTKHPNS